MFFISLHDSISSFICFSQVFFVQYFFHSLFLISFIRSINFILCSSPPFFYFLFLVSIPRLISSIFCSLYHFIFHFLFLRCFICSIYFIFYSSYPIMLQVLPSFVPHILSCFNFVLFSVSNILSSVNFFHVFFFTSFIILMFSSSHPFLY